MRSISQYLAGSLADISRASARPLIRSLTLSGPSGSTPCAFSESFGCAMAVGDSPFLANHSLTCLLAFFHGHTRALLDPRSRSTERASSNVQERLGQGAKPTGKGDFVQRRDDSLIAGYGSSPAGVGTMRMRNMNNLIAGKIYRTPRGMYQSNSTYEGPPNQVGLLIVSEATSDTAEGVEGANRLRSLEPPLGDSKMKTVNEDLEELPDGELFLRDTEAWYRKRHPDWSGAQISIALTEVRFNSLLEFYEEAIRLHPDLEEKLPLLPAKPYTGRLTQALQGNPSYKEDTE